MNVLQRQRGQSMTEFVVSAAFVLVPLFIIIPVVGKYIDMKLNTVQAARYVAWEYSAHYAEHWDRPAGFGALTSARRPVKSVGRVEKEAIRRFYSDTAVPVDTNTDRTGYRPTDRNGLWVYHNGLPMYEPSQKSPVSANASLPTPDRLKMVNGVIGLLGAGMNMVAKVFGTLGIEGGFDAINPDGNLTVDGRNSVRIHAPVAEAPNYAALNREDRKPLFGRPLNLSMRAKGGLLTETWGAGGQAHAVYQSSGLVPTVLIDYVLEGWGIPLQSIASTVLISPELGPDNLQFGYPIHDASVMDQVPVGALKDDPRTLSCPGGYCEN